jgi:hypothetical protein
MNYKYIVLFLILLISKGLLFSQWVEISPQERKETIYCVDIPNKGKEIQAANIENVLDTVAAVGWSSTTGVLLFTKDGGVSWELFQTPTFFPFGVSFNQDNTIFACGYNYLFDDAEVKLFDLSGNLISNFVFDGESLPYVKNFFDCLNDESSFYLCGYGGILVKYNKESQVWDKILVDSNKVFQRIKKFTFSTEQGTISLGFLLGGENFLLQNRIYASNPELTDWNLLYNFAAEYAGIEIIDFWFYGWDIDNGFPYGYVATVIDDTLTMFVASPSKKRFEKFFSEVSFSQPIGIVASNDGKKVTVVLDDGKLLISNDFGESWEFTAHGFSKQFKGMRAFNFTSKDLLPQVFMEKAQILAFGFNGLIAKYKYDFSLAVENDNVTQTSINYDEVEIYDVLGRLIAKMRANSFNPILSSEEMGQGVFLVIFKANGIPCTAKTYLFVKNF